MGVEPAKVTDSNFDEMVNKHSLALIDCWAPWCGPCQALGPIIDELAQEFIDKIKIGKVNIDENPQIPTEFGVMSIPTVILFKGGKEISRETIIEGKNSLLKLISNI